MAQAGMVPHGAAFRQVVLLADGKLFFQLFEYRTPDPDN